MRGGLAGEMDAQVVGENPGPADGPDAGLRGVRVRGRSTSGGSRRADRWGQGPRAGVLDRGGGGLVRSPEGRGWAKILPPPGGTQAGSRQAGAGVGVERRWGRRGLIAKGAALDEVVGSGGRRWAGMEGKRRGRRGGGRWSVRGGVPCTDRLLSRPEGRPPPIRLGADGGAGWEPGGEGGPGCRGEVSSEASCFVACGGRRRAFRGVEPTPSEVRAK